MVLEAIVGSDEPTARIDPRTNKQIVEPLGKRRSEVVKIGS